MSFRNLFVGFTDNPPPENRNGGVSGLTELEDIMRNANTNPESCVFLHPDVRREYTRDELIALGKRDFQTRLFLTGTQCAGDTVFLRTHHTDNAGHESHFNYIRDYLKAAHVTKNKTCAKSNLTTILTMCFELSPSDYYTFAISLASGLSNYGLNTDFEISDTMVPLPEAVPNFRWRFCLLMNIIFSKMATKKFLLDDKRSNIFRLVYCKTKYSQNRSSFYSAVFSFTLQLCLTTYVSLQQSGFTITSGYNINGSTCEIPDHGDASQSNTQDPTCEVQLQFNPKMFALAIFTFTYSFMVAMSTISETLLAYRILFKKIGPLMLMDFIVNIFLPLVLAYYGFLLILSEKDFINAVLNTTALLFIPEIDDALPQILGYCEDDIIRNFLITESMKDFDKIDKIPPADKRPSIVCGLEFGDYYITNMIEQGINAQQGQAFQPYQVTQIGHRGVQIDPSTTVTPDCLLRKIEWRYTTGYPRATKPRVGCLILTKIDGEEVRITRNRDIHGLVGINIKRHSLEGLFIMTSFQMSEDVLKLRVCGSRNVRNFLEAFDYYSLWDVTVEARRKILKLAHNNPIHEE